MCIYKYGSVVSFRLRDVHMLYIFSSASYR